MSERNGDESRYHRERKQKIAQRQRIGELLKGDVAEVKSVDVPIRKPQLVSA